MKNLPTLRWSALLLGCIWGSAALPAAGALDMLRTPSPQGTARLVVYVEIEEGRPQLRWTSLGVQVDGVERGRIRASSPFVVVELPAGKRLLGVNYGSQPAARMLVDL